MFETNTDFSMAMLNKYSFKDITAVLRVYCTDLKGFTCVLPKPVIDLFLHLKPFPDKSFPPKNNTTIPFWFCLKHLKHYIDPLLGEYILYVQFSKCYILLIHVFMCLLITIL